jgi:hypothetical protein
MYKMGARTRHTPSSDVLPPEGGPEGSDVRFRPDQTSGQYAVRLDLRDSYLEPAGPPLGPLKRRDGEPAFDEAWQTHALAMADLMVQAGVASADARAQTLGEKQRASAEVEDAANAEDIIERF